jgi:pseudouridine-5'-monophosphatase
LARRTGSGGEVDVHQLGELDDGWVDYLPSFETFPCEKYGVVVQS